MNLCTFIFYNEVVAKCYVSRRLEVLRDWTTIGRGWPVVLPVLTITHG